MREVLNDIQPDVVHVHNLYPLLSPSILAPCHEKHVPIVMTCHNYRLICPIGTHYRNGHVCELCVGGKEYWCLLKNCRNNFIESGAYFVRNAVARKSEYYSKFIATMIVPSKFSKKRLVESGFDGSRITTLPHMISEKEKIPHCGDESYVAFAGRICPEKGIQTLLNAARSFRHPIRLAGDYSDVPDFVTSAPSNVEFLGFLGQESLDDFYRGARFLIMPSVCLEVFGLSAGEAMSHGLPVIASRIGGLAEVVDDGVTGFLVRPGDANELAEKMKLLWENRELCESMGRAGREKTLVEFSEDIYFERLMEIYKKAIKSKELTKQQGRAKKREIRS